MFNGKKIAKLEKRISELEDKVKCKWGTKKDWHHWVGEFNAPQYIGANEMIEKIVEHLGLEFEETRAKEAVIAIKKKVSKKAK